MEIHISNRSYISLFPKNNHPSSTRSRCRYPMADSGNPASPARGSALRHLLRVEQLSPILLLIVSTYVLSFLPQASPSGYADGVVGRRTRTATDRSSRNDCFITSLDLVSLIALPCRSEHVSPL